MLILFIPATNNSDTSVGCKCLSQKSVIQYRVIPTIQQNLPHITYYYPTSITQNHHTLSPTIISFYSLISFHFYHPILLHFYHSKSPHFITQYHFTLFVTCYFTLIISLLAPNITQPLSHKVISFYDPISPHSPRPILLQPFHPILTHDSRVRCS